MLITDVVFEAFLNCQTKAWLKVSGLEAGQSDLLKWKQQTSRTYEEDFYSKLQSTVPNELCLKDVVLDEVINDKFRILLNCQVKTGKIQSRINALELIATSHKSQNALYVPIRSVPMEKLTKQDKLLLGFDAFVLSSLTGGIPVFGKIVHGPNMKAIKIKLANIMPVVHDLIVALEKQQNSDIPPPLILNKHCIECGFQMRCRKEAIDRDDLSLFSAMAKKERDKYHEKGIFSITQLSYTFRPPRKNKHSTNKYEKNSHALRALAIREQKIHVVGNPELKIVGTPVYLDVEGNPDKDFYYLIGMRFTEGEVLVKHSFWADEIADEKKLWASFLSIIQRLNSPQLIYYGSYEKTFLEKMRQRYGELDIAPAFLDQLQAQAINLVSFLFAQVYFPTYSNALKEIARYLGFEWTDNAASGITSLMWRYYWERHKNHDYKEKLLLYNAEDCEAIERLTRFLLRLNNKQAEESSTDNEIIQAESLNPLYPFESKFGKAEFVLPEFQAINKAAYWDYQQEKVYFRSYPRRKRRQKKKRKDVAQKTHINKIVSLDLPQPLYCPKCQSSSVVKNGRKYKVVDDIKFGNGSVKRWIVKYYYYRQRCQNCGFASFSNLQPWTGSKYGHNLIAYTIYQIIDLQISQSATAQSIHQLFGFSLSKSMVGRFKTQASSFYMET
jgi:predicted RecB family nuclease